GRVHDLPTLESFLTGRATTTGAVAAAFCAATCARWPCDIPTITELDTELDARTPSAALRAASRKLGRQLLRATRALWPHSDWEHLMTVYPGGLHQPIMLGATTAAAALTPPSAALLALHEAVIGPATAAVRLLGLDPLAVHATVARLTPLVDQLAAAAAEYAHGSPQDLPCHGAVLLDIRAEHHTTWEVRLFAS
ncbi:MAG: urease accessory protein UreF, partial [Pseudonocardiales bacterium]|nr:urease accessory protein UreF [Pseudonocardiales bacterium]